MSHTHGPGSIRATCSFLKVIVPWWSWTWTPEESSVTFPSNFPPEVSQTVSAERGRARPRTTRQAKRMDGPSRGIGP